MEVRPGRVKVAVAGFLLRVNWIFRIAELRSTRRKCYKWKSFYENTRKELVYLNYCLHQLCVFIRTTTVLYPDTRAYTPSAEEEGHHPVVVVHPPYSHIIGIVKFPAIKGGDSDIPLQCIAHSQHHVLPIMVDSLKWIEYVLPTISLS